MEFTVSKADLVRELSLSQGVVEKKTTIPILSNVLLEAREDRLFLTATDLELGLRTSCPAKVKKEGYLQADSIAAKGGTGLGAVASNAAASQLRKETDSKSARIVREANARADSLIAQAKR